MKTLDRQKLDANNKTQSNPAARGWRGKFTSEFVERDLREAVDWVKHLSS